MTGAAKLAILLTLLAVAVAPRTRVPRPTAKLTFTRNVAPIIYGHCAVCHRPGESGPFSLLTYQDVRRHARQIVTVIKSRFMPPWLPEPGFGEFADARRLTDDQINTIVQWVEQGLAEGRASEMPSMPKFTQGWQLGEPDLVVRMPRPYTLRATGSDVYRNFVLPVPVPATRYVKAIEIRPGNKKVVHHANILIDRTRSLRRLDGRDSQVGFDGMQLKIESDIFDPESHFLFWKPGTAPSVEPSGMSWRLDKGTDLILNAHLQPSGKPELIQASVGLYFTDQPPTRPPMLLQLENDAALDIPPGEKNFVVTDEFELPLDVDVLGVYPHAHYLGKDLQGYADLPDGTKKWLIWIRHWDPKWQGVYRYARPVFLPKGTVVTLRYTYDNSSDNVLNPNRPPKRVTAGNKSSDEMGHLWIQVLPRNRESLGRQDPRMILQESLTRHWLRKNPDDFMAHFNLGAVLQANGKLEEAIHHYREALRIRPGDVTAQNSLGSALEAEGNVDEAISHFRLALRVQPDYSDAHYNLGSALLSQGQFEEAATHFREVLRTKPEDVAARDHLAAAILANGNLLLTQKKLDEAIGQFREALRIKPEDADINNNLGSALAQQGDLVQAAVFFERAVRIDPGHAMARKNLDRARLLLNKEKGLTKP